MHPNTRTTLLEADRAARQAAFALEMQGKLPPRFTEYAYPLTRLEQRECRRLRTALEVANTPDAFVALARGEAVPAHMIQPRIVEHDRRRNGG